MIALATAILLSFTDPPGDAYGDGSLQTPTAAVNRTIGALDLTNLELYKDTTLSFSLIFASLTNPFNLANGFSFPIIEIYIDNLEVQGASQLLPGSDMQLPAGSDWNYAFKLSGDAIQIFEAIEENVSDISSKSGAKLTVAGNTLTLQTSLPRPESLKLYGMVGNYSPFTASGWMPTSASSSPWAYWSQTQTSPVVEVVASTVEKQIQAIQSGILPAIEVQRTRVNPWFFVMFTGLFMALLGLIARFWVKPVTTATDLPEVWVEEADDTPSQIMANQRLNRESLELSSPESSGKTPESEQALSQEASEPSENTAALSPDMVQDTHADEAEPLAAPSKSNSDLFDVWIDDESDSINWEHDTSKT